MIRILSHCFVFTSGRLCYTTTRLMNGIACGKGLPLKYNTKIPEISLNVSEPNNLEKSSYKIDKATICLLEQLSLVECANKDGIKTLEDAIEFAQRILQTNTDEIKPMYTVLEDRCLSLRDDKVTDGYFQKDVLKNAALTEEDYFVAPPGNIPLLPREHTSAKQHLNN